MGKQQKDIRAVIKVKVGRKTYLLFKDDILKIRKVNKVKLPPVPAYSEAEHICAEKVDDQETEVYTAW